jgi:hypothetical protein
MLEDGAGVWGEATDDAADADADADAAALAPPVDEPLQPSRTAIPSRPRALQAGLLSLDMPEAYNVGGEPQSSAFEHSVLAPARSAA